MSLSNNRFEDLEPLEFENPGISNPLALLPITHDAYAQFLVWIERNDFDRPQDGFEWLVRHLPDRRSMEERQPLEDTHEISFLGVDIKQIAQLADEAFSNAARDFNKP
jgi:hypothetical protein